MADNGMTRRMFLATSGIMTGGTALPGTARAAESAPGAPAPTSSEVTVDSPGRVVRARFRVNDGRPEYRLTRGDTTVLDWSGMGFELDGGRRWDQGCVLRDVHYDELDETWRPVWGAAREVRAHCRRAVVRLASSEGTAWSVEFRVFDDGVGFRYRFDDARLGDFTVLDELTEFCFTADHTAWSIPANYDSYEYLHSETPLSQAGYLAAGDESHEPEGEQLGLLATPATIRVSEDCSLALHEAALYDYPEMTLAKIGGGPSLHSALVPLRGQGRVKARLHAPVSTPWRTFTLGGSAGELVESHLVLNLNEPCALSDTSWIRPGTYVGVWWEIHKGAATWVDGPNLGATTENTKRYVDFAAANGIPYVLAEGWNKGWRADGFGDQQDFLTSNSQFDLAEVAEYAHRRGVGFLAHNETGGGVDNYERQIDDAFALYERLGLPGVKTGYAAEIDQHHHHDQWMVQHYQRVIEKAARHRLMIDAHEPIKATGIERTYPNFMSREGVRGQEYEAWSYGNPPEHTVTLPFTRMLSGPLDYTPGIFDITWLPEQVPDDPQGPSNDHTRVHTTRAHQMALYPVLLSGLQMIADVPDHYRDVPEFDFLRRIPGTWDETRVINGEIGDFITVARRRGAEWFVGSLTDENSRTLEIPLDFLGPVPHTAHVYEDAPDTDVHRNPNAVAVHRWSVDSRTVLRAEMTGGSGQAVWLRPDPTAEYPRYR